jgi:hypothetical protein
MGLGVNASGLGLFCADDKAENACTACPLRFEETVVLSGQMAISRQIRPRYKTRNEQIIADLRSAAGASAPIDPEMSIKRKTAEIAIAMALLHGGDWRVQIDHEIGFVTVVRR